MTHDTSEPTTDFTSSNSPANFVSRSCHLVLHCLDQVTHHNHTHCSFSLSTFLYLSLSIVLSLMAISSPLSREIMGESKERKGGHSNWEHKPAGMSENVKSSLTFFSQSFCALRLLSFASVQTLRIAKELIGSKGTDTDTFI